MSFRAVRIERLNQWLVARFAETWPVALGEALQYPLRTGGKRIRPALCFAAVEAVGGSDDDDAVLHVAAALELVHTYSLIHDDLPAMDNAELRRGQPTVHRRFGDAAAILTGDGLLTEAFAVLAEAPVSAERRVALVRLLSEAAGCRGMVGGQAADLGMSGKIYSPDVLERCHRLKTGALLRASVLSGAIVAGATQEQLDALSSYGAHIGLAFQLADDLLDEQEDERAGGPPSFVRLLGADATRARAKSEVAQAIAVVTRPDLQPTALVALAGYIVDRRS